MIPKVGNWKNVNPDMSSATQVTGFYLLTLLASWKARVNKKGAMYSMDLCHPDIEGGRWIHNASYQSLAAAKREAIRIMQALSYLDLSLPNCGEIQKQISALWRSYCRTAEDQKNSGVLSCSSPQPRRTQESRPASSMVG